MDLVCCVLGALQALDQRGSLATRTPECARLNDKVDTPASKIAAESADKSLCGDETVSYSTHSSKESGGAASGRNLTLRRESIKKELPGIFTRVSRHIGHAPTQESMARHVREAIKQAVLCESSHVYQNSDGSPASDLLLPDFGAIDRTMRCPYIDEKADGMQPGLRSAYAPSVFRALRAHFGLTEDEFCASVIDNPLIPSGAVARKEDAATSNASKSPKANSSGGGRSGAIFFFSADRYFVVKSVSKSEAKLARNILQSYFRYMKSYPDSLLPRIFLH